MCIEKKDGTFHVNMYMWGKEKYAKKEEPITRLFSKNDSHLFRLHNKQIKELLKDVNWEVGRWTSLVYIYERKIKTYIKRRT